jgi:hypothetical protein
LAYIQLHPAVGRGRNSIAQDSKMYQVLKTDKQFCFVLNTIATAANTTAQGDMSHKRNDSENGITFAEFITVSCMQTLQLIPARGTSIGSSERGYELGASTCLESFLIHNYDYT